jgi:hypothetical protein
VVAAADSFFPLLTSESFEQDKLLQIASVNVPRALMGDAKAQFLLAEALDAMEDSLQAAHWMLASAKSGIPDAMCG